MLAIPPVREVLEKTHKALAVRFLRSSSPIPSRILFLNREAADVVVIGGLFDE